MGKNNKRTWRLPELTTKAKIGVGAIIFIAIAAIGTYIASTILREQLANTSDISKVEFAAKDSDARKQDAKDAAIDALNGGNENKAANVYQQAIEAETDGVKKVRLAIDYSRMLSYEEKFDEAIAVAKEAESYTDDKYLVYDWLARTCARAKKYSEAEMYYKKAGALVSSPTNVGKYTKEYYDKKAEAMKAQATQQ